MKCKTTAIKLLKLTLTDVFSRTHNNCILKHLHESLHVLQGHPGSSVQQK